jgi:hypothetical protein
MIINTGPFHYPVGDMAGVYFAIYGYGEFGDRAIPNIMIALAVPLENASVFVKFLSNLPLILPHAKPPLPGVPF